MERARPDGDLGYAGVGGISWNMRVNARQRVKIRSHAPNWAAQRGPPMGAHYLWGVAGTPAEGVAENAYPVCSEGEASPVPSDCLLYLTQPEFVWACLGQQFGFILLPLCGELRMIGFLVFLILLSLAGTGLEIRRKRDEKALDDAIANAAIREHIRVKQSQPQTRYAEMTNDEFRVTFRDAVLAVIRGWLFKGRAFGLGGMTLVLFGPALIIYGASTYPDDKGMWLAIGFGIEILGVIFFGYSVYCKIRVGMMRRKMDAGEFHPIQ